MQVNKKNLEAFIENAENVSAFVYKSKTLLDATIECIKICEQKGMKNIAVPDPEIAKLFSNDYQIISHNIYEKKDSLDIGFTICEAGIAKTGTLVINSSDENLRIATMLCDIHVAVVKASDIVGSASHLSCKLKDDMNSSSNYTAFITGASRTADIERTLAIGVHGPLELHIIILEGI
jgi:L-lactate dehydrogenase complex protein LldG